MLWPLSGFDIYASPVNANKCPYHDREDVNIVIVMKAMGAESDQEIIQLVGEDETLAMLLVPTIQDCKQKGIFTQGQALDYLGKPLMQGLVKTYRT